MMDTILEGLDLLPLLRRGPGQHLHLLVGAEPQPGRERVVTAREVVMSVSSIPDRNVSIGVTVLVPPAEPVLYVRPPGQPGNGPPESVQPSVVLVVDMTSSLLTNHRGHQLKHETSRPDLVSGSLLL